MVLMNIYNFFKEIFKLEEENKEAEISSISAKEAHDEAIKIQRQCAEAEIDEIFQKIQQKAAKGYFFCYVDNIDIINQDVLSKLLGYNLSRVIDSRSTANIWKISWEEPKEDAL